jgi:hypothetical protein
MERIHSNNAESFFSRMRRAEIGHHHHLAGPYLIRFAQEASWREDHRKDPNGSQVDRPGDAEQAQRRFLWILAAELGGVSTNCSKAQLAENATPPKPELFCPYCLGPLTTPHAIALHKQLQESARAIRAASQVPPVPDETFLLREE